MAVVEHEAKRQVELLESGGAVAQETRLFDPDKSVTRALRSKEDAHDYRYFPDPDLLPLELDEDFIEECRTTLPELPDAKRKRYEELGITAYNAGVLTAEVETARWFDALLDAGAAPAQAANWVVAELFGALTRLDKSIEECPVSPVQAAELLGLVADKTISTTLSKQVFEIMLETGEGAAEIVDKRGLRQTSDTGSIDAAVDQVLAANGDKVEQYKAGKQQLFGFFVGQVMKTMGGKANPQVVNERLRAKLD
jgi:aspartyl-tRNA(Asn)/glutamyl-tRNA(Gln) amidotransferase subunit B